MGRLLLLALAVLAAAASQPVALARRPAASDAPAYRQAASRARRPHGSGEYDAAFSDAEESLMVAFQGDTAQMLADRLSGRSERQVRRRCIELGLRCAGDAAPPARHSEKWRARR